MIKFHLNLILAIRKDKRFCLGQLEIFLIL